MKIYGHKVPQPEAARIAGVTSKTIQNWIMRDLLIGHKGSIEGGGVKGKARAFSIHSIMQVAVAADLVKVGLAPKQATTAAADFAHVSGGGEVFGLPFREPGLPFHHSHGETIFAVAGERTFEELWKPDGSYDTYGKLRRHLLSDNMIAINVFKTFCDVCAKMNANALVVLDEIYTEDAG